MNKISLLTAIPSFIKIAKAKSEGRCAHFVATFLEKAGFKVKRQKLAKDYHYLGELKRLGFEVIKCEKATDYKLGDVIVIDAFNEHKSGHICVVCEFVGGEPKTYSDFKQKSLYGLKDYKSGVPVWVYRFSE